MEFELIIIGFLVCFVLMFVDRFEYVFNGGVLVFIEVLDFVGIVFGVGKWVGFGIIVNGGGNVFFVRIGVGIGGVIFFVRNVGFDLV